MKKLFLIGFCSLFVAAVIAQEVLSPRELKELRQNPDTSNTVYGEKVADAVEIEESRNIPNSTTREDPDNPGVFITESEGPDRKSEDKTTAITFGKMRGEPMSESSLQKIYPAAENPSPRVKDDLDPLIRSDNGESVE